MDVSRWPMDRIMQLPDHCFGRRWPIAVTVIGAAASPRFDISEMALPERCVIWEFTVLFAKEILAEAVFEIRLGDVLPTTMAQFREYEVLFKGVRGQAVPDGLIHVTSMTSVNWQNFKMPVQSTGRRIVVGIDIGVAVGDQIQVALTVSSIPREVPDCLLSV
ncbi:hypothetical protein ES703_17509 [subsurface metagenome]